MTVTTTNSIVANGGPFLDIIDVDEIGVRRVRFLMPYIHGQEPLLVGEGFYLLLFEGEDHLIGLVDESHHDCVVNESKVVGLVDAD